MATVLSPGDRVFITDPSHPWVGRAAEIISGEVLYGLGWKGYRARVDETCGMETYVRPDQVMGPGRVDKMTMTITCKRRKSGKVR